MDRVLEIIGMLAYAALGPTLIWGWWRWSGWPQRLVLPTWRTVVTFCGLFIASVVGIMLSICSVHMNAAGVPNFYLTGMTEAEWSKSGFLWAGLALGMSFFGKGPARLPAALASLVLIVALAMTPIVFY